jgi:hypothetical protein
MDAQMRAEERIAATKADASALQSSYTHDSNIGITSQKIIDILRLVPPFTTIMLWVWVIVTWFIVDEEYDFKA